MHLKSRKLALPICAALVLLIGAGSAIEPAFAASITARGSKGQSLSISHSSNFVDGEKVVVSGKNYSTKVGIYVTYCVIPPKGQRPDLCGPFDITGANNASTWVSSNPPIYAKLLVKPFGKGGSFRIPVTVTRMIGDQDCTMVRCAITTRADHTLGSDRSADVFIPVTITGSSATPSPQASITPAP